MILLQRIDFALAHGNGLVGRTQVNRQLFGLLGEFLYDLHARSTLTDDGDTLSRHIKAFGGPLASVPHLAFEGVEAWPVGVVTFVGGTSAKDEILARCNMALFGLDGPCRGAGGPFCRDHLGGESDVLACIDDLVDVLEVVTNFSIVGEAFGEIERSVHLGDGKLVEGILRINTSARVGVVTPDTAQGWRCFE